MHIQTIITTVSILLLSLHSHYGWSQLQKGDMFLGASILYRNTNYQTSVNDQLAIEDKKQLIQLSVEYSIMCSKRFDVSLHAGYTHLTTKDYNSASNPNNSQTTTKRYPIIPVGLGARYSFPITQKLYISADFYSNYQLERSTSETIDNSFGSYTLNNDSKSHYLDFELGPGLTYLFNQRWSTRLHLGVINYRLIDNTNITSTSSGFNQTKTIKDESFTILADGFVPSFAFYFQLNKRKNKNTSNE